jgi:hypothetical protein
MLKQYAKIAKKRWNEILLGTKRKASYNKIALVGYQSLFAYKSVTNSSLFYRGGLEQ